MAELETRDPEQLVKKKMPVGMIMLIVWFGCLFLSGVIFAGRNKYFGSFELGYIAALLRSLILASLAGVAAFAIIKRFKWAWKYVIVFEIFLVIMGLTSLVSTLRKEDKYSEFMMTDKYKQMAPDVMAKMGQWHYIKSGELIGIVFIVITAIIISIYIYRKRNYFL